MPPAHTSHTAATHRTAPSRAGIVSLSETPVATGWMAVRRAPGQIGLFEKVAALVAFGTSATLLKWGFDAHAHPTADDPALPFFIFAAFAACFGALDIKFCCKGAFAADGG